jgi:predicted XRE-type DNA-binding protein
MPPRPAPLHPEHDLVARWRQEVARRIAHRLRARRGSQSAWAASLGIPQPTLSQIMNGRVARLSLELLLRVAARAGVGLALQPDEATAPAQRHASRVIDEGRAALAALEARRTPSERAEAFLEHNEWLAALAAAASGEHRGTQP